LGTVTVMKTGFGVSTGFDMVDDELEGVGLAFEVDVDVEDELEVELEDALVELELADAGVGATSISVVVTVGPGLMISTVLVGLTTVVACAGWFPPSTLMTE
jgi:hypothetical protein